MVVFGNKNLILTGYTDFDFYTNNKDIRISISGSMFTLNERTIVLWSIKQGCIEDSIIESKYLVISEVIKEVVWLRKFLIDLEVVPNVSLLITLHRDKSDSGANSKMSFKIVL